MNELDLKSIGGIMAAVMAVAALLKHAWPAFPNRAIPLTCLGLGVPSYIVFMAGNSWTGTNIMTAVAAVALAIGAHSGLKSTGELFGIITPPNANKVGLFLITSLLFFATGCKSIDPVTGQQVFDPVKTMKVRAAIKPFVAASVARIVEKNPEANLYFDQAASAICEMRDAGSVSFEQFRARIMGIIDQHVRVDPLVRAGFVSLVSVFEFNYADRLNADLPPDKFTWNLLDVLCEGIRGGIGAPPTPVQ